MPKSFLVRKKSGTASARAWATPTSGAGDSGESDSETGYCGTLDTSKPETPGGKQTVEENFDQPKRVCRTIRKANQSKEPANVSSDRFKLSTKLSPAELNCYYNKITAPAKPELSAYIPFPHLTLFPNIGPTHWKNPLVYSHVHVPAFMHLPASVVHQMPQVPQFATPLHVGVHPYALNVPLPVGVTSPAEMPSPAMTDELLSRNSTCETSMYLQKADQSHKVLQMPIPRHPMGGQVNHNLKPPLVKREVINNGFGIKNPVFSERVHQPLHPGFTAIPDGPPGDVVTSEAAFHRCSLCGVEVDSLRQLQKHVKTHKEVKRFLCTVCGKGFNDTFDLKRHTRTHTGVRPYRCEKCGKAFTQRCSLESHRKKIHGIQLRFAFNERRMKVYVCEECGHSTSDPEDHVLHLRTQHPHNPALLRCHDRRQFKFRKRKYDCLDTDFQERRVC